MKPGKHFENRLPNERQFWLIFIDVLRIVLAKELSRIQDAVNLLQPKDQLTPLLKDPLIQPLRVRIQLPKERIQPLRERTQLLKDPLIQPPRERIQQLKDELNPPLQKLHSVIQVN